MNDATTGRGARPTVGALVVPWLVAIVVMTVTGCDRSTKTVANAPSPATPSPSTPAREQTQSDPAPLRPQLDARETSQNLTKEQERNQMPLPGQANDHSAPAATEK